MEVIFHLLILFFSSVRFFFCSQHAASLAAKHVGIQEKNDKAKMMMVSYLPLTWHKANTLRSGVRRTTSRIQNTSDNEYEKQS